MILLLLLIFNLTLFVGQLEAGQIHKFKVEYDEPTTTINGDPLTNLKETIIEYRYPPVVPWSNEHKVFVPATSSAGGGHIVKELQYEFPDDTDYSQVTTIEVAVNAVNIYGVTKGGVQTTAPAKLEIPDGVTNITITNVGNIIIHVQ